MKINYFIILLLFCSNGFYAQKLDSILIGKFIQSIEIDNNQIFDVEYKNKESIQLHYSVDSSFVIITQGECKSIEIENMKKPCNRMSIFSTTSNRYFNILGFQKTDMGIFFSYLQSTNQQTIFLLTLSKIFNVDYINLEKIFENWEKYVLKKDKYERKIDKQFKIIAPNPYLGNKIW